MQPQPHNVVILAAWAATRAARVSSYRPTCAGCPHLVHLPATQTARCMLHGGALIAHGWQHNDARPAWCRYEQKEKA